MKTAGILQVAWTRAAAELRKRMPTRTQAARARPWQDFARAYSDEELAAIYAYLRSFS
jgi:hypothetical protein